MYDHYGREEVAARETINKRIEEAVKDVKGEYEMKLAEFEAVRGPWIQRKEAKEHQLSKSILEMKEAKDQVPFSTFNLLKIHD